MLTYIYKKIIKLSDQVSDFTRKNLAQIVIIVSLFVILEVLQSFPYVNIIPNYQFLIIGFTLFLSVVLLRVSITNKKIILAVLILFFLAAIITIFDVKPISDMIGFAIFVLLTLVIIRQVASDRKKLQEVEFE